MISTKPTSIPSQGVLLLLLAAATAIGCNRVTTASQVVPRNVLIVSIDTLRADHVGAYGDAGAKTPTIDRLALAGTRFDAAFSPVPLTLPSHSTMFTGRDPDRHGVRHNGIHRLAPEAITLGERLSEAGFATAGVVGSLVIAAHSGLAQGFQEYDDAITSDGDHATAQRTAASVNDAAIRFLDRTSEPFFLFVHYYDPHRPYEPPSPYREGARTPYDGEISYTDSMLGELLAHLERSDRLDDTLVVVTSDHGESLGEHDELTHGHAIYDATQRVPLVMRGPGIPTGRVVQKIARIADITPTILARLGLRALEEVDGIDLESLWQTGAAPARLAYLESLATRYDHGWSPLHGLRNSEYLYIQAPQPELYDLSVDADQRQNLLVGDAGDHAALVARFEDDLARRRAASVTAAEQDLDAAALAQLHALGYAIPATIPAENGLDAKIGRRSLSLFHAGDALYQSGHPREAAQRFEEMLLISPESGEAWLSLGAAWLDAREFDQARSATQQGIDRMPRRGSAQLQLGVIEMAIGLPADAERSFRKALALSPEAPGPRGRLIRALVAQGKIEEALVIDHEISALGSTNEVWLRRIADLWEAEGQTEVALSAYRRVLVQAPHSQRDHVHAAIALIRLRRLPEAQQHLMQTGDVLRQPRARAALAASYLESGYAEEARLLQVAAPVGS